MEAPLTDQERKKQYATCKERGHSPAAMQATLAVFRPEGYNDFIVCKYCRTSYRFVTTMEETNVPND